LGAVTNNYIYKVIYPTLVVAFRTLLVILAARNVSLMKDHFSVFFAEPLQCSRIKEQLTFKDLKADRKVFSVASPQQI